MKVQLLTLLLLFSCTKYAAVKKDAIGIEISPVQMAVSRLDEIEWLVGMRKEHNISQSFTFMVDMPKLKEEDLSWLTEQKGIDSWIVRLIVDRGNETQDLGSLYTLFKPKKIARVTQNSASSSVIIKVFYAAAYASERFRSFKCPAFGHNLKISKMEIKGMDEEFSMSVGQMASYGEKSQQIELMPTSFNGGNSLVGDYYVEIAPYDSKNKLAYSTFKRIPMYISVTREDQVRIPSCDGVHQELQ